MFLGVVNNRGKVMINRIVLLIVWLLACNVSFVVADATLDPMWVTVYVHGTTSAIGLKFIGRFCKDVAFGQPGVHHLNELPDNALLRADVDCLQKGAPDRFCSEHFYTFGWSGQLSFKARAQAGKDLFTGLKALLADYKCKYGFYPKLRIMTFSHGGNVALNMVQYLPFLVEQHVYLELLIIACPVQKVTEKLIEHDEIDHVYTIASSRDLLQVVDFYTYDKKRYFPDRFFHTSKLNCHQIKVSINDRGLGHLDLLRSFIVHLPYALNMADAFVMSQIGVLGDSVLYKDQEVDDPMVIDCSIQDDKFRFFKGLNLIHSVRGHRKK